MPTLDRAAAKPRDTVRSDEPIRVLVIDDERFHAEAVAESLERVGYECVVATSGAAGARKIEEENFDVILTMLATACFGGEGHSSRFDDKVAAMEVHSFELRVLE